MKRVGCVPKSASCIDWIVTILVLDPDSPFHYSVILDAPTAGTILVQEVRHIRIQPVNRLVKAFCLPVAEILRVMGATGCPQISRLQNVAGSAVGSVEIDLEPVEKLAGVILAMLYAFGSCHGRIAIPVESESAYRSCAHNPVPQACLWATAQGCPLAGMRLMSRIAIPPADIDHHIFETERRDIVDERVIF